MGVEEKQQYGFGVSSLGCKRVAILMASCQIQFHSHPEVYHKVALVVKFSS